MKYLIGLFLLLPLSGVSQDKVKPTAIFVDGNELEIYKKPPPSIDMDSLDREVEITTNNLKRLKHQIDSLEEERRFIRKMLLLYLENQKP